MNWLAHVFLSSDSVHCRIGNLIADLVRCREWEGMPEGARVGMRLHQEIDRFTDAHAVVRRSKTRLGEKGKLRGVVVDVVYDHMLAKNWDRFSEVPLREFVTGFYGEVERVLGDYPEEVRGFLEWIVEGDRLGRYGNPRSVPGAMARIDERLSERVLKVESASEYYEAVLGNYDGLEGDFLRFFPGLVGFVGGFEI